MARVEVQARETTAPLAMLGVGIALLLVGVWRLEGPRADFSSVLVSVAMLTGMRVLLLLVGAFITARLISASFGNLNSALLKFAALVLLPSGLSLAINVTGVSWVVSTLCWFILLIYLFELDPREALIFTGVMIVIDLAVGMFIAPALMHT